MTPVSDAKRVVGPLALLLLAVLGCDSTQWGRNRDLPPEPPPEERAAQSTNPLIAGTIGERTLMAGELGQPLRGFGLVVGLDDAGSSDCPTVVREYLMEFFAKQVGPRGTDENHERPSPARLIDSPHTAAVEVLGYLPPGARPGTRFDLRVQALPGTSTTSLRGGLLLPMQLRYFDRAASGRGLIAGAVLAEGGGPVFVSPFADSGQQTSDADKRRGTVLGGGRATEGRTVRLNLLDPNYAVVREIERRINERFGPKPPIASAWSRGFVVLETPPAYADRPALFRRLVAHLYLDRDPAVLDRRLRNLHSHALASDEDLEHVSLIWEGVGRQVLPHVQTLYAHGDPSLRFYAARAGLRVGDTTALPVIAELAAGGPHALRLLAIRELGETRSPQAPLKLAPLLSNPDQEVRVAAYEALLQRRHPAIESIPLPHLLDRTQLNFVLDIIDCEGPSLIYVRRTRQPRIAVFGRHMSLMPPVFYVHPEDSLTVHTVDGADDVRLFMRPHGRLSDEITVPPRVADVILALAQLPVRDEAGRLQGMGLSYARVTQVLADLCESQTVTASLVFERTSVTDLLGPQELLDRPEAERFRPESDDTEDRPVPADEEPVPSPREES
jgi:hypothetical protein